ncbi:U11/U12 small nuclear ribonucleoprotein 48 kDa protein-like isoform X1 [Dermacentor andersoni]|uniref:U11/U12 small nuclear ribonucleoprotein 48 kDa protein-like isoform X1 n=1 Tax=Dermacentor andersoni TaxID=34620 RepID=UPI002155E0CE|nr:U11/U12 small nuclear ribonucleoprotein 48 kDa protein-like isoform X1 [Dermacentor andersoni]
MNPSRETQLRRLKSLIQSSETQLTSVLEKLKWSKDEVLKKKGYVVCPIDPGHTMPEASLSAHLDLCAWLKEGYSRQEKEAAPPSSHFFYGRSTSVVPVLIDRETQSKIITDAAFRGDVPAEVCQKVKNGVPLTMERCFSELTAAERFAVYDYVVERAKATNKASAVKLEDLQVNFEKKPDKDEQHPPSELELKRQMRDYKRRRQSYRAKNVHITQKTYTEILREVIQNQTEYLKQLQTGNDEGAGCSPRLEGKDDIERQPLPRASEWRDKRESSVASSMSSKWRRSRSPDTNGRSIDRKPSDEAHSRHRSTERHEHKKHHRSHHHKSRHKHKHKSKDTETLE